MDLTWIRFEMDTPSVVIHKGILEQNIMEMSHFAQKHGVNLRPHIKTHKIAELAQLQLEYGSVGITTAKMGEAEEMCQHGITDILIAYPIVGRPKLERLKELKKIARITTVVDSIEQAQQLSKFSEETGLSFEVLVEVDTGLNRCGVLPGKPTVDLYKSVGELSGIHVKGIMTHAGHAYGARSPQEVKQISEHEGSVMVKTAEMIKAQQLPITDISVGATPTVRISGTVEGVSEIRPGNYVFNDMTQVRLGAATINTCSLRVVARVVGRPASDRYIIDAGAKTLALDQGAHGTTGVSGFGYIVGHPELTISRLSEEHGIVQIKGESNLAIGDLIEIIPNHSCPVVNLTDTVILIDEDGNWAGQWKVTARGLVR